MTGFQLKVWACVFCSSTILAYSCSRQIVWRIVGGWPSRFCLGYCRFFAIRGIAAIFPAAFAFWLAIQIPYTLFMGDGA
jgi:hypothetical protein